MPLCVFQRHGSPRDLHSFPTRRSSDLAILAAAGRPAAAESVVTVPGAGLEGVVGGTPARLGKPGCRDRKSTRLNSSHQIISYAVFCLKKKKLTTSVPNGESRTPRPRTR